MTQPATDEEIATAAAQSQDSAEVGTVTLERALSILTTVHLRDDADCDFVILIGAAPDWGNLVSSEEYNKAWKVVWEHTQAFTRSSD